MGANSLFAQQSTDFKTVDSTTYAQYSGQFWDELVQTGENALAQNIDYFYLRVRLGAAYFQLKKYREAEVHFNKAYQFNNDDAFLNEYLYFTYIKNEHFDHAQKLSASFDSTLKARTVGKDLPISLIYTESGGKISNDATLYNNAFYFQFGLGHRLSKYLNFTHAYTNYSQNAFYGSVVQHQYYLGLRIPVKKSLTISPSLHYVTFNLDKSTATNASLKSNTQSTTTGMVGSLSLKKSFNNVDFTASYAYSNLNDSVQNQQTINATLYPFANNKLSISGNYFLQQRSNQSNIFTAFSLGLTYTPSSKFKISASYYSGNLKTNTEENGFVVNNSYFVTTSRFILMPQIAIHPKLDIYTMYQLENKALYTSKFQYNNIFLGLKFKF